MPKLESSLRATLDRATSERPVHRWLIKNPLVLSAAVEGVVYPKHVVSSFKMGTDFVTDFVAFGAFSGACCFHFIELEPPGAALFTQKGVAARRLNEALTQIARWKAFVETRRSEVLRELAKALMTRDVLFGPRDREPTDTTGMSLYDPRQWVAWKFHVVIGRRETLSKTELGRKASYGTQSDVDVMTYDRLIDCAAAFDRCPEVSWHDRPTPMPSEKIL